MLEGFECRIFSLEFHNQGVVCFIAPVPNCMGKCQLIRRWTPLFHPFAVVQIYKYLCLANTVDRAGQYESGLWNLHIIIQATTSCPSPIIPLLLPPYFPPWPLLPSPPPSMSLLSWSQLLQPIHHCHSFVPSVLKSLFLLSSTKLSHCHLFSELPPL